MAAERALEGCIRDFLPADTRELTAIIEESPQAAAWTPSSPEELQKPMSPAIYVSESAGQITGFIVGRHVADEAEILNLAVRQAERRKGHASALLHKIMWHFRQSGVTRIFLEVRESNAPAITFYKRHGFQQIGRRANYYRHPEEAALVFEKQLTG